MISAFWPCAEAAQGQRGALASSPSSLAHADPLSCSTFAPRVDPMSAPSEPVAANTAPGAASAVALPSRSKRATDGSSAPVWSLESSANGNAEVPLGA